MTHSVLHRLHNPDLALLLIRLGVGFAFAFHGWQKVSNPDATVEGFATMGVGAVLTYIAMYTEFIGGVLVIVGFFTRYAGIALAIFMAVGIYLAHLSKGYSIQNGGYEYALMLMLGALALVFTGAGRYSIAGKVKHARVCQDCEVGAGGSVA